MNTLKYFTLNEQYGDMKHIGTVVANNDDELNVKVKQAIESHFDNDVKTIPALALEEVISSRFGVVNFEVLFNSELLDDGDNNIKNDDTDSYSIEISETWLY